MRVEWKPALEAPAIAEIFLQREHDRDRDEHGHHAQAGATGLLGRAIGLGVDRAPLIDRHRAHPAAVDSPSHKRDVSDARPIAIAPATTATVAAVRARLISVARDGSRTISPCR